MTAKIQLGIDTGGTYTDAVLIDLASRTILARAKAITTKGNLAVGVGEAMAAALASVPQVNTATIASVSVSTTLATNAVVEGHGSPTGAILIGFDDGMVERTAIAKSLKDAQIVRVQGGHDHNGDARHALDEAALQQDVLRINDSVSAYAIAASFAVRNAAHEFAARDIIGRLTGKPVTLSSELSSDLDAPRRALTAVLNARLIPRISQLIDAVRSAMLAHGLSCPLMIVRGDGSVAKADAIRLRPIETVLSGPAASVIGAKWLSGKDSFIMSDIGGTTTDVAVVENGAPRVAPRGAEVGGWRTMVKAIDIKTIGLGGDSEVLMSLDGKLSTSTQRALPIALLGSVHPQMQQLLEQDLSESSGGSQLGRFLCLPFGASTAASGAGLSEREAEVLALISATPVQYRKIAVSSAAQRAVASLRNKGLIQVAAFTPSDAAHVLGKQDNWSLACAELAARLACRHRDMKEPTPERVQAFCAEVFDCVTAQSCKVILQAGLAPGSADSVLMDRVAQDRHLSGIVHISLSPVVPIVAVGGPAAIYYPEVGRRLACEVVLAPDFAVTNSVGAAVGGIAHRARVVVEGDGSGLFKVFDGRQAVTFPSGVQALAFAEERARAAASEIAGSFGARDVNISVRTEKSLMPDASNDDGLLTAVVTALASTDGL